VAQDHVKKDLLFAGTEFGIYATLDGGRTWLKLGGGVPTISFRDLEVQERESDLVGASFGRGFFVLDDYSPLRTMAEDALAKEAALFPVRKALRYMPLRPLDSDAKNCLGEAFYLAPNPPYGAVFTYYLRDGVTSAAEARRAAEAKLVKDGQPVPFPGWDALRREENEPKPAVVLVVRDEAGQVVRQIAAPAGKGLHRAAWNLRYPAVEPTVLEAGRRESWERDPVGPMVVPGRFTVTLAKVADGVTTTLAGPETVVVESLDLASLPAKDKGELLAFQKKAGELQRAMMGAAAAADDALRGLGFVRKALLDTPGADPKLAEAARAIEKRLQDQMTALAGDRTRGARSEPTEPSLMERVTAQLDATGPVTATAKRGYEIAADGFEKLLAEMRRTIEVDLKALQADLEAAGAPWTPGRGVPVWKK
jgi:hypothetical protein